LNIYFHKFNLLPQREINSKSTLKSREGVFLKSVISDVSNFWEYFPHPELGDQSVDSFLTDFSSAKSDAQKKAHLRLTKPLQMKTDSLFLNHELYHKDSDPKSPVIKYKLFGRNDFGFIPLLQKGHTVRLDANGIFNKESWIQFKSYIPEEAFNNIEYIEDPFFDKDWSHVGLETASDFVDGSPCSIKIYKPYRELFPIKAKKIIFSSPMGHLLGTYLTFLEMINFGNLDIHHGLMTPGIYKEVPNIFTGNFKHGFRLNQEVVDSFFENLSHKEWLFLCTA
jgi:hypothetical protein